MNTIKKRINSTGRKRIPRDRVSVTLLPARPGQPLQATASVKLEGLGFPESANVVLEAYQRSTAMRFDIGSIGKVTIPDKLDLVDIDPGSVPLFRLKVVDSDEDQGKLLGAAERLRPDSEEAPDGKKSIFPVHSCELGPLVWKVKIDDAGPCLLLNWQLPTLKAEIQKNPLVAGILLPAALQIVLEDLASDPTDADDEDCGWKADWVRFCQEELGVSDDPSNLSTDRRQDWIDECVEEFCKSSKFMSRIRKKGLEVQP